MASNYHTGQQALLPLPRQWRLLWETRHLFCQWPLLKGGGIYSRATHEVKQTNFFHLFLLRVKLFCLSVFKNKGRKTRLYSWNNIHLKVIQKESLSNRGNNLKTQRYMCTHTHRSNRERHRNKDPHDKSKQDGRQRNRNRNDVAGTGVTED